MDLIYAPLIKQEFLNTEQQLLNVLSDADTNIKVKNEPILDEDSSMLTIKNEPFVEATLADNFTVKTENQLESYVAPSVDSFIIYELETQQHNKQIQTNAQTVRPQYQLPTNTNVQTNHLPVNSNERSREIENKHIINLQYQAHDSSAILSQQLLTNSSLIENISLKPLQHQQSLQLSPAIVSTSSTTLNNIAPASPIQSTSSTTLNTIAPAASPILLNTKLRKRNKNASSVSLLDKRTRYNIEGTLSKTTNAKILNAAEKTSIKPATNTGCKKIINHIIKHRRVQRQNELRLNDTTSNSKNIVKTIQPMAKCDSTNLKLITNDVMKPKPDKAQLINYSSVKSPISSNTTNFEYTPRDIETSTLNISCITQTENIVNPIISLCDESLLSPKDSAPSTMPELRVKCLCRLTDDSSRNLDNSELTDFFKQMFEKTKRLTKKQQRNVKISLLQAISDAEEAVEQGKCCF